MHDSSAGQGLGGRMLFELHSLEESHTSGHEKAIKLEALLSFSQSGPIHTKSRAEVAVANLCKIVCDGDLDMLRTTIDQFDPSIAKDPLNVKDKYHKTPLHYAAEHQHFEICKFLVEQGADVNICDSSGLNSLHYAASHRHLEMCEYLIQQGTDIKVRDKDGRTALHQLVCCSFEDDLSIKHFEHLLEMMIDTGAFIDAKDKKNLTPLHLACDLGQLELISLLLKYSNNLLFVLGRKKADVTQRSWDGWNALDYAIKGGSVPCVQKILKDMKWKKVLKNRGKVSHDGFGIDTPMRKLILKMPEVAEEVLTSCCNKFGDSKVSFDYELLDDECFCTHWSVDNKGPAVSNQNESLVNSYSNDLNLLKKNHPLNIVVELERKKLLCHPLVVSLLNSQWNRFVCRVYCINLLFYLIFMVFFNLYMLMMPPPYFIDSDSSNMTSCVMIIPEAQPSFGRCYDYNSWGIVAKGFVIALSTLSLLKELYLVYSQKMFYFISLTNLFEVTLYILAILTVYSDTNSGGPRYYGIREDWQWQIGAVSVFLSWMVLIMFIKNLPTFGIYVLMFTTILGTFMKFFVVIVLFILGFAFSFHCLLQNQYGFQGWWNAVVKTSLMMIGEFGFKDIFVAEAKAIDTGASTQTLTASIVNFRAVSYILFVIFVIVMSIIMMNLLVGLAVDDVKSVLANAEFESLAIQVKLTLDIQYLLPQVVRRRVIQKSDYYIPNRNLSTKIKTLNPEMSERDDFKRRLESLEEKIVTLGNRSRSMEGMMSSIVSHFNIGLKENDDSSQ